jgi:hypothetical protein
VWAGLPKDNSNCLRLFGKTRAVLAERSIVSEKKGIVCLGEARIVFVEALCLKKVALDDLGETRTVLGERDFN